MLDPNRNPEPPSRTANIVAAVLLTIFALPILATAGCFPFMILSAVVPDIRIAVVILFVLALAFCGALAYHAQAPGYRVGFIIAAAEVAILGLCIYVLGR